MSMNSSPDKTRVSNKAKHGEGIQTEEIEGDADWGYAILIALSLSFLHATLAVLCRVQYGQEVEVKEVLVEAASAIPVFTGIIYICHPRQSLALQLLELALSIGCGCYIVYLFNVEGYYASMSRAPAIGTLLVWLTIEMEWYFSLASLVSIALFLYLNDFALT